MEPTGENTRSSVRNRRQTRRKTAYTVSSGIVLLAAAGALVTAGAVAAPAGSGIGIEPPATDVPAGALTAVCPQPLRLLAGNVSGTDAEYSPVSESARTAVSTVVLGATGAALPPAELRELEAGKSLAGIKAGQDVPLAGTRLAGVLQDQSVGSVTVMEAEPSGTTQTTASSVLGYTASDGDLAGLAAANCQTPANDIWLLGARTTVGATAVLRLSNPSATAATVDLELHGSAGRIESGGSRGIVVAPGETRSIILAGLAANEEAAAVRVRSSGGPVTAVIEQSVLRGLTPGGVEIIQPTAAPSPRQVISGVALQSPATISKLAGEKGHDSVAPVLNVAVPGSTDAVVHLRVFGSGGEEQLPGGGVFSVPAGTVGKIPLADLPEGTYSLDLSSDVALTAAAVFSRGTEPGERVELAVAPADTRMGSDHLAVAVPGGTSSLVFTAPDGTAEVRVRAIGSDGVLQPEKTVEIPAGRTVSLKTADLGTGNVAAVLATAVGEAVYGAQLVTGDGPGVSVLPLPEGSSGSRTARIGLGF